MLLPAVREAAKDALIIADGFSCKEQIEQTTERRALHLAQVLQMALREGVRGPRGKYPERRYLRAEGANRAAAWDGSLIALAAGGALAGAALLWTLGARSGNGHRHA